LRKTQFLLPIFINGIFLVFQGLKNQDLKNLEFFKAIGQTNVFWKTWDSENTIFWVKGWPSWL